METILIIEDDTSILKGLERNLEFEGYNVISTKDGEEGLQLAFEKNPDLIILDIMLPNIDGFEICRLIRRKGLSTLILILTARDKERDKIRGLELGADDYLTKPFSLNELIARVKALLRRKQLLKPPKKTYVIKDIKIDVEGRSVKINDKEIELSSKEFDLLVLLLENKGKVLSRDEILNNVWGYDYFGTPRTVDNFITKLRHKLNLNEEIITVRGIGYKMKIEKENN